MRKKEKVWNSATIKELRAKFNLSQAQLSLIIGTRQQTVSEWETDEYVPHNAYIQVLDNTEDYLEGTLKTVKGDLIALHRIICKRHGGLEPHKATKRRIYEVSKN